MVNKIISRPLEIINHYQAKKKKSVDKQKKSYCVRTVYISDIDHPSLNSGAGINLMFSHYNLLF